MSSVGSGVVVGSGSLTKGEERKECVCMGAVFELHVGLLLDTGQVTGLESRPKIKGIYGVSAVCCALCGHLSRVGGGSRKPRSGESGLPWSGGRLD